MHSKAVESCNDVLFSFISTIQIHDMLCLDILSCLVFLKLNYAFTLFIMFISSISSYTYNNPKREEAWENVNDNLNYNIGLFWEFCKANRDDPILLNETYSSI